MKKISFDLAECNACGECLDLCDALSIYNWGFVDHAECEVCGECVDVCDTDALEIKAVHE
ncbi:hypothetical protein AKJ65_03145 [candidate division MSBL1 archaeon SCGC-AAA259E19]|uniref:4Fe-4S ferredoxin-type domain-containing protein n=1 Tax=candidate division MSBL1 archaeon SCGC-AAA259E19 TaxID=1698264 RepID=A0A133UL08_9EURY|nr:hypothetical protein AKJ65_03145 [candidate division MSBL1 archaeon SCGC-AAA259E19]